MSIPWYGILPNHWYSQRIKTLFSLRDERNYEPLSDVRLLTLYTAYGVRPHDEVEKTTGNRAVTADGYKIVYENDIIVNIILCWQGAIGLSKYDGVTSPAYDVYKAKSDDVNVSYYNYLFRLPIFSGECYKAGRGIMAMRWRTYSDQFTVITVPLPPRHEQDQIVRYLDWKVSQINKLINAKQRQIGLLREYIGASIDNIFRSATESATSLTRCTTKIGSGKTPRGGVAVYVESGIMFIRSQNVYPSGLVTNAAYYITDEIDESMRSTRVYKGDVLLNITGGSLGRSCVYDFEEHANVNQHVCIIRPNHDLLVPEYLTYYLNSPLGQEVMTLSQNEGNRESLTFVQIGALKIPLPSVDEQKRILKIVNAVANPTEAVINRFNDEISYLAEYRTRLLSDIVTGKLDVQSVAVPEYEVEAEAPNISNESDEMEVV